MTPTLPRPAARLAAGVALGASLLATAAGAQQRPYPTSPPPPAPVTPAALPPFQQATLANGLRIIVVPSSEQPVLSVSLAMPAGSAHDPTGKEGLASMVAGLLTKGAGSRTAEQIAADIEGVGGSIGAGAGADFLTVGVGVLAPHAELAFRTLADVVQRPTFPQSEVDLARQQTLAGLQLQLTQPAALASRFFNQNLYGRHPYARSSTPASVNAIGRADLVAYQQARLRPSGALLVIAGDLTLDRARTLAEQHFGTWAGRAPAAAAFPKAPARARTEIVLVHRPGSVQSNIMVGNTAWGPADRQRYAAAVANRILGGGADSRLFQVLREEKGWTYGSYSDISRPLGAGAFVASAEVRTEVTDSALVELLAQLRRLRSEPVTAAELEAAKSAIVGSFPLALETAEGVAGAVSQATLYGLGTDYLHQYRTRMSAVTAADVRAAAQAGIRPDSALVVVVGDGAKLHDRLARIAPVRMVTAQGDPVTAADLAPATAAVPFDVRRMRAGTDSFTVMIQGNALGYTTLVAEKAADGWTLRERTSIANGMVAQTTTVTVGERLEMRAVQQAGKVQGRDTKIELAYQGGKVTGSAATPTPPAGEITTVAIDAAVPASVVDDNALTALLPMLPWAAGAKFAVPVFAGGRNALETITLGVAGTEAVAIPSGTIQAYRVEATGGSQPITFFVEVAAPHRVLKIAPVGAPLEMIRANP